MTVTFLKDYSRSFETIDKEFLRNENRALGREREISVTAVRSGHDGSVGQESDTTNDRQECKDYDHFTRPSEVSLVSSKNVEEEFLVGRKDDEAAGFF